MTAMAYDAAGERRGANVVRLFVIAMISFLTLVDLFATQAILPSLATAYDVSPAMMGTAVNLCTAGMAVAGLLVALFNRRLNRRWGVAASLGLLAIPTALLAFMPELGTFAALRLIQGVFMSAAFSLTIAYLAENAAPHEVAAALAAYVTGNVASNLFGRLMSAAIADHLGLPANFVIFAGLNLTGAVLAYFALRNTRPMQETAGQDGEAGWTYAFRQKHLAASFAIGFVILFAFIGTFTYVNFVLVRAPLDLSPMQLGFVYFVFVPSIILTPLAGKVAHRFGARRTVIAALGIAALALPSLLSVKLELVLAGLAIVAAGTFFAQATATGFVSRRSGKARGSAGGIYLSSYYAGGLVGSIVLGRMFDALGWPATVTAIGAALLIGCVLALHLREPKDG
jgi:YNFM family putative membrane transporter